LFTIKTQDAYPLKNKAFLFKMKKIEGYEEILVINTGKYFTDVKKTTPGTLIKSRG